MIEELLKDKKLILVCGSGGVGKTTTSASLGLKAAGLGKKVIVLTIDPAKRLATSLGLENIGHKPKRIDPKLLEKATGSREGEFYAMMLDTKSTFDQLVAKYAPDKATQQKILNNKIYQHLSDMIAGSQEYMAMEKLYEIASSGEYELVIIDTPPTTHAIDFLEAPERMINMISHSMMHILIKPAMMVGKSGLKLFEKGTQMIVKVLDRITGYAFLQDISEMLYAFQELLGGFQSRAEDVKKLLADPGSSFILVSSCEEKSVRETELFIDKLKSMKLPMTGIVLNRVYPHYSKTKAQVENDREKLATLMGVRTADKMIHSFERFQKRAVRDRDFKKEIEGFLNDKQFLRTIPLFESDIHDIAGLYGLSQYL